MRVNAISAIGCAAALVVAAGQAIAAGQRFDADVPGSWNVRLYAGPDAERQVGALAAESFPDKVQALGRKNGAIAILLPGREDAVWVLPTDVRIDLPTDVKVVCSNIGQGNGGTGMRALSEDCDG